MLVCIDSTLLIFIKQQEAPPGYKELFRAADAYEKWVTRTDSGILLPTPVISEVLGAKSPSEDARFVKSLQQFGRFRRKWNATPANLRSKTADHAAS